LQDILAAGSTATDASGNAILADVGTWLRDEFKKHFKVRYSLLRRCESRLLSFIDTQMHSVTWCAATPAKTSSNSWLD
jgi:6-phosphofructokinase 1